MSVNVPRSHRWVCVCLSVCKFSHVLFTVPEFTLVLLFHTLQVCDGDNFQPPNKRSPSSQIIYNLSGINVENYLLATTNDFIRNRWVQCMFTSAYDMIWVSTLLWLACRCALKPCNAHVSWLQFTVLNSSATYWNHRARLSELDSLSITGSKKLCHNRLDKLKTGKENTQIVTFLSIYLYWIIWHNRGRRNVKLPKLLITPKVNFMPVCGKFNELYICCQPPLITFQCTDLSAKPCSKFPNQYLSRLFFRYGGFDLGMQLPPDLQMDLAGVPENRTLSKVTFSPAFLLPNSLLW